jgi:hypothetical protein
MKTTPEKMGPVKKLLAILSGPLFGYFFGSLAVSTGVPLVATFVAGSDFEIQYTVEKVSLASSRRCKNRIQFADMPIFNNQLCWLSTAFKDTFSLGDPIIVVGRGTAWGVFPSSARHSE